MGNTAQRQVFWGDLFFGVAGSPLACFKALIQSRLICGRVLPSAAVAYLEAEGARQDFSHLDKGYSAKDGLPP